MMEQRKLTAMRKILESCKLQSFKKQVLDKVLDRIHDIRGCYEIFLQDDGYFLAWILTIDGLFLLYLFDSYNTGIQLDDVRRKRLFAQDLIMAENQIPFMVLKKINLALDLQSSGTDDSIHSYDDIAGNIFRSFCETHSPLELCSLEQAPTHVEHLLDYMYHSIVKNVPLNDNTGQQDLQSSLGRSLIQARTLPSKKEKDMLLPISNKDTSPPSFGKSTSPIILFLQNIPWEMFGPLYKQTVTTLETFSKNQTNIYSASKLHGGGFKFHLLPKEEGMWKIDSKGKEIHLPCLDLHTDSEVILRNLVVYEMLSVSSDDLPLTEYVGLMCGLIMNINDVKVLQREKIVQGDLREDEVVTLFSGMSSCISTMRTSKTSMLQVKIVEVNTAFESGGWYVLVRNISRWLLQLLNAISVLAGALLKIVVFLISLITVFLLTSEAYCDAYGCGKTNVSLLTYAPFSHAASSNSAK